MRRLIKIFDHSLESLSRYGLIASLFSILLLTVTAIILRWTGSSVLWIEPLVRHMVFLCAFLGGSLATSKNVHIRIDLFSKLVEKSNSRLLKWFHFNTVSLFCLLTTAALFKASWDFFLVEKEFGAPAFLEIHSSWLVGIIPLGIGLITLRFLNQLLLSLSDGEVIESHRL